MKKKWIAGISALALALTMAGCGGSGEETTVTGMVVSLEGTTVSLMAMDENRGGGNRPSMPENGEMPAMPEGMENFTMPEGFDPDNIPEDFPDGFEPGNFNGEMPAMPEGMDRPEMPSDGEMPNRDFSGWGEDLETTSIDIGSAHISVEIEGGKEGGSLESITPGSFLTITLNSKGEATYVLVSAGMSGMSGFGGGFGGFRPGN